MQKRANWKIWVGAALAVVLALVVLAAVFVPKTEAEAQRLPAFVQKGLASWYGPGFHNRKTASGEPYDQNDMTAAHRNLPLGTTATVTNLENGKKVEVEINDRGPYAPHRVIDLSKAAAEKLDMKDDGTAPVRIEAGDK